jgi:uncharacterized membrane protein YdjX (TVP38/TMEM64 family)
MKRRLAIGALLLAGVLVAVKVLPLAAMVERLAESARQTGAAGVAIFFVAYVIATMAAVPGSLLTLAVGFAYGPVWGLALASPASVTGATCAFLLGRTWLRGWAERIVSTSPKVRAVDAALEREACKLVLLLRLSPVFPFNALNYVLSLSRISLRTYVLASFLGMLPRTAFAVYLGSLVPAAAALSTAGTAGGVVSLVIYGAGLMATVAVVVVTTRAARRALASELEGQRPSPVEERLPGPGPATESAAGHDGN